MKNIVKEYRKKLGITQAELATQAGVSRPYLSDIENEKVNPTLRTVGRIAEVLQCSIDDLFEDSGEEQ